MRRSAAAAVIHDVLGPAGGEGGVITMDAHGTAALEFNTNAMFRGTVSALEGPRVAVRAGEALAP